MAQHSNIFPECKNMATSHTDSMRVEAVVHLHKILQLRNTKGNYKLLNW